MVALVAASPEAQACMVADQYRLLPLGTSKGRIVALELDQFRASEDADMEKVFWTVEPRLVYAVPGGAVVDIKKYAETKLDAHAYDADLAPIAARALADAKKLPNFHEARIASFTDCHYSRACGAHVISGKDHAQVRTKLRKARPALTRIRLPERFLLHKNAMYMIGAAELGALDSDIIKRDHPDLLSVWLLGSVRIYRLANKKRIAVYNLGNGDTRYYRRNPRPKPRTRKLHKAAGQWLYDEDLPHHGYAFDIIVALD